MKTCQYWNCRRPIRAGHFLCLEHYDDWEDGLINKCPECGRYKDVEHYLCLDCRNKLANNKNRFGINQQKNKPYRVEKSKAWGKKDKEAKKFFVYILKEETTGKFYAGQTRDLRARLWEHKDGKTRSTAGRKMNLIYFEELPTRDEAVSREAELKSLINRDERKLRNLILEFRDRVREVKFE